MMETALFAKKLEHHIHSIWLIQESLSPFKAQWLLYIPSASTLTNTLHFAHSILCRELETVCLHGNIQSCTSGFKICMSHHMLQYSAVTPVSQITEENKAATGIH
jgi:hypothetical protein